MKPALIGIPTYGRNDDGHFFLPSEYVESVRRSGACPILLPPGEEHLDHWFELIDGILFPGGGDIEPARYGGGEHEMIYMVNPERDTMEFALLDRVLESGLPTLGICRGTQLLNVALGGTLFDHLPDHVGGEITHRLPPREPTPHPVQVEEGSGLAEILGETGFTAESWHHQAIRDVAPGLTVVARAPDGTIEAVEKTDHPWLYAVQWHPELTAAEDPIQQRLFNTLAEAALAARQPGTGNEGESN
ncbi:MAG: gamma-glutamyl-gamma-aminobutyrate hydrolase family protein [Planctomycetota bacterium]